MELPAPRPEKKVPGQKKEEEKDKSTTVGEDGFKVRG